MRKNGFTLAELLGVMVLLALISLITVPAVTESLNSYKTKLCNSQIDQIISAAKSWAKDNMILLPENDKDTYELSLKTIVDYGYIDKKVNNPVTNKEFDLDDTVVVITKKKKRYIYTIDDDTQNTCYYNGVKNSSHKSNNVSQTETAGIYDAKTGKLIASWEYLVDKYNLNIERDYEEDNFNTDNGVDGNTMSYVLNKNYNSYTSIKLVIPSSVKSIGLGALLFCTNLESITIPSSVTSIGDGAFAGCTSLTSISIPSSVTSIGNWAFEDCTSLTSISIPSSVTSIGDGVFLDCTSLTNITIPSSVTSIGDSAFEGCTSLTNITIPSSVTSIGDSAFRDCISLTSITIPSSVTSIGNSAFLGCTSLTNITIPSSVTSIGDSAFEDCTSLTNITIPSSVTSIGNWAFEDCTSLTNITIPSSVTSIGNWAFEGCTSLTNITIPSSVTVIGDIAFEGCSKLTSINVDSGNPNYSSQDGILFDRNKTTLVKYPPGKTDITYTVPSNVTNIRSGAFRACTYLTSITIPSSVLAMDYNNHNVFANSSKLTSINVDSGNRYFSSQDGILFDRNKTTIISYPAGKTDTTYTIPDSVTLVNGFAFQGCTKLSSIIIPSSVITIGRLAFNNCTSLTNITIPSSVTSIEDSAFLDCTNLNNVTFSNASGWKACKSEEENNCTNLTVTNTSTNVTYLKDTYLWYDWKRG